MSSGSCASARLCISKRFGEAVQLLREKLDEKNVYYMNPALIS